MEVSGVLSATVSFICQPSDAWKALAESIALLQPQSKSGTAFIDDLINGNRIDVDPFRDNPPEYIIKTEGELTTLTIRAIPGSSGQSAGLENAIRFILDNVAAIINGPKKG